MIIRKRDNSQKVLETNKSPLQAPYLIVVGRQLVQQLLDSQLLSRTVDIGDFLFWEAAIILVHLRDRIHSAFAHYSPHVPPPLATPRKAHGGTPAASIAPTTPRDSQLLSLLPHARTEEHPKRQSRVNCPSLGAIPLWEMKIKGIPYQRRIHKCTGEARGEGFPSRLPVLLYHFLCRCPMEGTSVAKGCVSACLNTALRPFSGTRQVPGCLCLHLRQKPSRSELFSMQAARKRDSAQGPLVS